MKKKLGITLALVSALFYIYLTCYAGECGRLNDISVSKAQIEQLKAERSKSPISLIQELYFNDEMLFFDSSDNTYYYSMPENCKSADNPHIRQKSANASVALAFLDEKITSESIKEDHAFTLIAYDENFYSEYNLKCTNLPMMNINCVSEIERENVPMNMTLFDNRAKASQRLTISEGNIHIRGASTSGYPKKSFRVSLIQKSLGDNQRSNKVSLLGMRQDDDWILYPAFNDNFKIKNVFSSNLWKYTCAADNSLGIDNGMEYKYIELFMNGKYWGLYALGYPIDELQLEIDFEKNEHLYKKTGWDRDIFIASDMYEPIAGYETTENSEDAWYWLRQYYRNIYANQENTDKMYSCIDIDNAIDIYLFLNLIQGIDNARGGDYYTVKNLYFSIKHLGDRELLLYTPWDMDLTWGSIYTPSYDDNVVIAHGALQALITNGDDKIWNLIFEKYWNLRNGLWSYESINKLLDEYEADIYASGAYERDKDRWPDSEYSDDNDLSAFREFVMKRLDAVDNFCRRLEEMPARSAFTVKSAEYDGFLNKNFVIDIGDKNLLSDSDYADLLEYIGIKTEKITESTRFILVNGISKETDYISDAEIAAGSLDTCIGKAKIIIDSDSDSCNLLIDDVSWLNTPLNPLPDIQLVFGDENGLRSFDFTRDFILNPEYGIIMEIINHNIINNEEFIRLVKHLGIESKMLTPNTDFIVFDKTGQPFTILNDSHSSGCANDTVLGTLSVFYNESNGYGVYLNSQECITVSEPNVNKSADIRIAVIQKEPYEVIRCKDISY